MTLDDENLHYISIKPIGKWSRVKIMKQLLIIYHTMTGGSLQMALAALLGASQESGVIARLAQASIITPDALRRADGYIFVTPENLGSMSGMMKDLFDRCYYHVLDSLNGRPCAVMVCAGSDGQGAVRQFDRILQGLRLKQVLPAYIVITHAQTQAAISSPKRLKAEDQEACQRIGETLAIGMASAIF